MKLNLTPRWADWEIDYEYGVRQADIDPSTVTRHNSPFRAQEYWIEFDDILMKTNEFRSYLRNLRKSHERKEGLEYLNNRLREEHAREIEEWWAYSEYQRHTSNKRAQELERKLERAERQIDFWKETAAERLNRINNVRKAADDLDPTTE